MVSQDDWVRQARELSITSPLSVTAGFPFVMDGHSTVVHGRVDEHMVSPLRHAHGDGGIRKRWMLKTMLGHRPLIARSRIYIVYTRSRVARDRGRPREVICL